MSSTYDVVMQKSEWKSRGCVLFANNAPDEDGSELKLGYYPCTGVSFRPSKVEAAQTGKKEVWYCTEDLDVGKVDSAPQYIRRLRLQVVNPTQEKFDEYKKATQGNSSFPPQALLFKAFIEKFDQLVFSEYSHDVLVSTPMIFEGKIPLLNSDGTASTKTSGPHSIVFVVRHIGNESDGYTMITEAVWDNGAYRSEYGCC